MRCWDAQQAAIEAVRPGVSVAEVDQAARKVLQKNGLAQYFTHSPDMEWGSKFTRLRAWRRARRKFCGREW